MTNPARIATTVIGGFLGAGKTTLLNHILGHNDGLRRAVLVNDFGALNIDTELIEKRGISTIALTNGCVCCQIGDDLSSALIAVIDGPNTVDAIIIEASGISDPWRIAQVALADNALSLDGVLVLLDASTALSQLDDPLLGDTLMRQLRAADLLVINKCDLIGSGQLRQLHLRLQQLGIDGPLLNTSHARVPAFMIGSVGLTLPATNHATPPSKINSDVAALPPHTPDHGFEFEHWTLRSDARYSSAELRRLLKAMPAGVLRLKGLLHSDAHGISEIQFAGRHGSLRRAINQDGVNLGVIAIGTHGRLDRDALAAAFGTAQADHRTKSDLLAQATPKRDA